MKLFFMLGLQTWEYGAVIEHYRSIKISMQYTKTDFEMHGAIEGSISLILSRQFFLSSARWRGTKGSIDTSCTSPTLPRTSNILTVILFILYPCSILEVQYREGQQTLHTGRPGLYLLPLEQQLTQRFLPRYSPHTTITPYFSITL